MRISRVKEVQLSPFQVPHGRCNGLDSSRLGGSRNGDEGGAGDGASEDHIEGAFDKIMIDSFGGYKCYDGSL